MKKLRENRHNRVYHLISRIAHRSFYLDDEERDRFMDVTCGQSSFAACWGLQAFRTSRFAISRRWPRRAASSWLTTGTGRPAAAPTARRGRGGSLRNGTDGVTSIVSRGSDPLVLWYTTTRTQKSPCRAMLRNECCTGYWLAGV